MIELHWIFLCAIFIATVQLGSAIGAVAIYAVTRTGELSRVGDGGVDQG